MRGLCSYILIKLDAELEAEGIEFRSRKADTVSVRLLVVNSIEAYLLPSAWNNAALSTVTTGILCVTDRLLSQ